MRASLNSLQMIGLYLILVNVPGLKVFHDYVIAEARDEHDERASDNQ